MNLYQPNPAERSDPAWAWAAYEPGGPRPWNLALVGHLHRRAGFGATWAALKQSLERGPGASVDSLLAITAEGQAFERRYTDFEQAAVKDLNTLGAWWLRRMIESPHPLRERMTLFWHNHFAVSARELDDAQTMVAHLQSLRRLCLGSFHDLLFHLADDPAVYIGLGATAHRRLQPEDGFTRPLIERFTVGPDVCSVEDMDAAARAWSGWFVFQDRLRFIAREQDTGHKTFLGHTGPWQRADILNRLLARREAAETIVRRLYRWLISEAEDPEPGLLDPLIDCLHGSGQFEPVVARMLRSNLFFSAAAYRQSVKSPVAFAVGLARSMEATVSTTQLAADLAGLGQRLGDPPTVHGWSGGRRWINAATLAGRHNLAAALFDPEGAYGNRFDPEKLAARYGHAEPGEAAVFMEKLLLQTARVAADRNAASHEPNLRRIAYNLITRAEYQLA